MASSKAQTASPRVIAIVAMDEARVIGNNNSIPWHIPGEQKYFASKTRGHTVLMGRKTYESLPARYRPLPDRLNVVVSRSVSQHSNTQDATQEEGVLFQHDPLKFIERYKNGEQEIRGEILWVIGGQQIYECTKDTWDELYLTLVKGRHPGDAYFPEVVEGFEIYAEEVHESHSYQQLRRRKST